MSLSVYQLHVNDGDCTVAHAANLLYEVISNTVTMTVTACLQSAVYNFPCSIKFDDDIDIHFFAIGLMRTLNQCQVIPPLSSFCRLQSLSALKTTSTSTWRHPRSSKTIVNESDTYENLESVWWSIPSQALTAFLLRKKCRCFLGNGFPPSVRRRVTMALTRMLPEKPFRRVLRQSTSMTRSTPRQFCVDHMVIWTMTYCVTAHWTNSGKPSLSTCLPTVHFTPIAHFDLTTTTDYFKNSQGK